MTEPTSCPDPARLKRMLDDAVADSEECELTRHLETCPNCQRVLDGFVARTQSWSRRMRRFGQTQAPPEAALEQAMEQLKAEGSDAEPTSNSGSNDEHATGPDPSLGFLGPSARPECIGRLGHYDVIEVVGQGGMGVVLKSLDSSLHRIVAIKVLASHLATNATARRRFVREARAAAAVSHDHVVTIYAVEESSDPPYIVMQYVDGKSLQERLDRTGPLELKEILRIGMQAAAGLAAAHAQGLVHRDIKPANILLENGVERVKITDFGLARAEDDASLTQSGIVAGTPQYMAPEQASGEVVDARADLFSLGSVMYAMCTGRPPFRATTAMAVLKRVCEEAPSPIRDTNPDMPDWLTQLIAKLHAKNPADRFQSAAEVEQLLGRHLARLQQPLPGSEGAVTVRQQNQKQQDTSYHGPTGGPTKAKTTLQSRPYWATAAAIVLLLSGLALTEATGISQLVPTVIRIVRGDGTLVLEVNDPQIQVAVDGEDVVLSGAGPHEIRLRPGKHQVQATRDSQPILEELVTITRGDKQVVKVGFEPGKASAPGSPSKWPAGSPTRDGAMSSGAGGPMGAASDPLMGPASGATVEFVKLRSPQLAFVTGVFVRDGDFVKQGQPLAILRPFGRMPTIVQGQTKTDEERIEIRAPCDAKVAKVYDRVGETIDQGHVIVELEPAQQAHGPGGTHGGAVPSLEREIAELRSQIRELSILAAALQCTKEDRTHQLSPDEREVLLKWLNQIGLAPTPEDARGDALAVRHTIDELVKQRTQSLAATPDDDATFLSRIYVDLLGLPPTAEDVRTFQADPRPSVAKRAELIDRLLADPAFSERWARTWREVLAREPLDEAGTAREIVDRLWHHFLGTGDASIRSAVAWGATRDGWQVGVMWTSGRAECQPGEEVPFQVKVRNVANRLATVPLKKPESLELSMAEDFKLHLRIKGGEERTITLEPGEEQTIRVTHPVLPTEGLPAGFYGVRIGTPVGDDDDQPGELGLQIAGEQTELDRSPDLRDVHAELKSVAWGKPVLGLQAGVRFSDERTQYSLREEIGADFFLRNITPRDIEIEYSSSGTPNDWVPVVTDQRGQVLRDFTLRMGGQSDIKKTLKPGEAVLLGHPHFLFEPKFGYFGTTPNVHGRPGLYRYFTGFNLTRTDLPHLNLRPQTGELNLEITAASQPRDIEKSEE